MADTALQDPLGRTVILTEANWRGHVVKRHRDIAPHRALAEAVIVNPTVITFSPTDPECRLYFGAGPRRSVMIVVAANVVHGYVKTAHLVRRVKGVVEWSRPTP